ncbi:hypothetical protein D5281_23900 [bacterium 1xD42-62]|uniref:Uncharacterized protein n=1 Tax=Parablautia muri TaxID=2320879 RepID=A0A9X5BKT1_9FIRM|nr:hypothetical protein [Parablautia muri]RKI21055.1 hypothetical protein D7V72_21920 [bacterium D16-36]
MERKLTLRDFGHEIIKKDLHLDPFGVGEELQHEIPALEDHPAIRGRSLVPLSDFWHRRTPVNCVVPGVADFCETSRAIP